MKGRTRWNDGILKLEDGKTGRNKTSVQKERLQGEESTIILRRDKEKKKKVEKKQDRIRQGARVKEGSRRKKPDENRQGAQEKEGSQRKKAG